MDAAMPGARLLPESLYPGHPPLLELPTPRAVLAAVQMNAIEFHTWNAVKTTIDKPDRIVFDLDPGEGVPWENVRQAARVLRALLSEIGLDAWLKTSGGKGLHVLVPLRRQHGWETTKDFSAALVRHLAQAWPQLFVAKSGPRNRVGRIYADYLRNGFGATTVAPWSARARPGLPISVPISWDELEQVRGGAHWTIADARERLDIGNRPWDGYAPQAWARPWRRLVRVRREGARLSPGRAASGRQRLLHRRRRMPHVVFLFIERNGVGPCIQEHRAHLAGARPLRRRPSAHVPRRCLARPRPPPDRPRAGGATGQGVHLVACP